MAGVSITYKGNAIAKLDSEGSKTLKTGGCYCENDIVVSYSPPTSGDGGGSDENNCRVYEITLAKNSGWILLTELDADVVAHINDASLVVSLTNVSPYAHEFYAGSTYIASNTPWGCNGSYPTYGLSCRESSATACQANFIYYPPNNTDTNVPIGGYGMFRIDGYKYYFKPSDGFVRAGTYRLVFTW